MGVLLAAVGGMAGIVPHRLAGHPGPCVFVRAYSAMLAVHNAGAKHALRAHLSGKSL